MIVKNGPKGLAFPYKTDEGKAVEVFLQAGGEGGIAEIHLIYGIVAEATETIA